MTIRQFAKSVGFEVVGNLKKASYTKLEQNKNGSRLKQKRYIYYVDYAGNEYHGNKETGYYIVTPEGTIITQ